MVDMYKQLLVHQEPVKQQETTEESQEASKSENWREGFSVNPNTLEYGDKQAEIVDFVVLDEHDRQTNTIHKGSPFTIKMRVHFNENIQQPIMAFTFKNIQGTEITGTNTMFEKAPVQPCVPGDEYVASFTQNMDLQGESICCPLAAPATAAANLRCFIACMTPAISRLFPTKIPWDFMT